MSDAIENVIIIGSGPAGHTAAIYAGRAELSPLMFEGFMAGGVPAGGQLTTTTDVENFPGFPEGVMAPDLMDRMREQTLKHGSRILTETVTKVDLSKRPFSIQTDGAEFLARALIIATGATAKRLGVKGEDLYWQKGISACAVCDGALPIYRKKQLVVVGGGDTACEEAIFLTKYADTVNMIHRRDALRAQKALQSQVFKNEKINIIWDSVVVEAVGEQFLTGVKVQNVKDKNEKIVEAAGLFYAVGHIPNTDFLDKQLEMDETGYIVTKPGSTATSIPGVFACGDVQDKTYRQAVTAAGTGCMAALETGWFLIE